MEDVVLDCDPGMIVFRRHKTIHFEEAILWYYNLYKNDDFQKSDLHNTLDVK